MCGIGGLLGVRGDHGALASRMLAALRHRGPDDEGVEYVGRQVTLVHSRLAIFDTTAAGHQPMAEGPDAGRLPLWVVFNGAIYNFPQLREELSAAGCVFRTRTDTEVILHAYRRWGPACVDRFRGMFAFCIVDEERREAFLCRDRLGIKPLYLYEAPGGGVVVASELRAILALGPALVPPRIRPAALESFLAQGAVQGEPSLIEGVTSLAPGSWARMDLERARLVERRCYWELPLDGGDGATRAASVEELAETLRETIRLHLISDVPLGLFLSGGLDSTAVLALAAGESPNGVRTLNVGFDIADFDESATAAATAESFGAAHQLLPLRGDLVLQQLPAALEAMDQPTVDGINVYFVSQAARQAGLTVVLSGLGGDELFGGYASFRDVPRGLMLRRWLGWMPGAGGLGYGRRRSLAKAAVALRRDPEPLGMYLLRRELFLPRERRDLHALPAASDAATGLDPALLHQLRARAGRLDPLNAVSLFEIEVYMRHMLLRDADVFSMAAPVELRVPFLDHRLVELVFRMPGEWKRNDPRAKPLLVDAVGADPLSRLARDRKRGFAFPWGAWLGPGGALAATARDALEDAEVWRDLGLDPAAVRRLGERWWRSDHRLSPGQILAFIALRGFARRHGASAA